MTTKKYLFSEDGDALKYKGTDRTFDLIYKNINDPWGQSDASDNYYSYSREKLSKVIDALLKDKKEPIILEIGCGNGFSTAKLKTNLKYQITGCDISEEAINQAKSNYSEIKFFSHNIKNSFEKQTKYDVVIVSNLLWYILEDLETSLNNCFKIVKEGGHLIFLNAFLKQQRYGKNILDGFEGMKKFIKDKFSNKTIHMEINDYDLYPQDHRYFGLLLLS